MEYLENTGQDLWEFDVDEFLEESQDREKDRLEEELARIENQLEERDRIHREALDELEGKLEWYIDRLEQMYSQRRGKMGNRDKLKEKISEFYKEIRAEKQIRWRDKQELQRERRKIVRELDELDEPLEELLDL